MGSQHVEVESEAWYRAIAEGRLAPVSDRYVGQTWPPAGAGGAATGAGRPLRDGRLALTDTRPTDRLR